MKIIQQLVKLTITFAILFLLANPGAAQTGSPHEEKLLNGLRLLAWRQKGAEKVTVKLRIHSGSAFDPQNKEGVMAMFADILFPNRRQVEEFFAEDLNGSVEIVSNYDYIQITATGDKDKFLNILDTIAQAVSQPQIDKETTPKIKLAHLATLKELEANPAHIADLAVRKQLLGDFPYGRAQNGTSESIAKIDFVDLIFAQERFLTADNATLTITGDFKTDLANRAVRRYFGSWRKSEKIIPSTFAVAEEPKTTFATVESPSENSTEIRYAMRGLARKDKDFYASKILSDIYFNRLKEKVPAENRKSVKVEYDDHVLPGIIIFGVSGLNAEENKNLMTDILSKPVTEAEFSRSKTFVGGKYVLANQADLWLDIETYKLGTPKEVAQQAQAVTISDVNRIAEKMKNQTLVSILVTK
ncbi:hypothetical protein BH20ACI4_BH20ACI4_06220 [soil metagenome]